METLDGPHVDVLAGADGFSSPTDPNIGSLSASGESNSSSNRIPSQAVHTRGSSASKVGADLKEILDLLLEPTNGVAWDFLFADDAQADINCLANTSAISNGSFVQEQVLDTKPDGTTFTFSVNTLFVPAFSVKCADGRTIELGVSANRITTSDMPGVMDEMLGKPNVGRYAVDLSNTTRVEVSRGVMGNPRFSGLCYFKLIGAVAKRQLSITYDHVLFKLGARTGNLALMQSCIMMAASSMRFRNCLVCGRSHDQMCGCCVTLKEPSHPMDFQYHRSNSETFSGVFSGEMCMVFNQLLSTGTMGEFKKWWKEKSSIKDFALDELYTPPMYDKQLEVSLAVPFNDESSRLAQQGLFVAMTGANLVRLQLPVLCSGEVGTEDVEDRTPLHLIVQRLLGSPEGTVISLEQPDTNSNAEEVNPTRYLDPREERRRQRQLRNRQSAARSNARRKEANEKRKAELANVRDRVQELRKREEELRKENTDLRSKLFPAPEEDIERELQSLLESGVVETGYLDAAFDDASGLNAEQLQQVSAEECSWDCT